MCVSVIRLQLEKSIVNKTENLQENTINIMPFDTIKSFSH